jgi:acyl transferase domain-containing protein/NAD(P)H-dependent flavin oxidoreductase YrpB (nitropropane dioxygenase family)/NAD(P)-dependent dehydrogenase (short-subunit alcohol dehydrogenase family)
MAAHVPSTRDLVVGITPFERPDPALALGIIRAGALGVLDLGHDRDRARLALAEVDRRTDSTFGVRVPDTCGTAPSELPRLVTTVILAGLGTGITRWREAGRRLLVEARSLDEARAALAEGADGIVARGSEGGGRVAEETAFVLLQRLIDNIDAPIWVAGGIGLHSAAAAIAGGAAGVVHDAQLALVRESSLPADVRHAVASMDGSETAVVGGHRLFFRPDLPVAKLATDTAPAQVAALLGGDDLRQQLLPAGQEAAFARPMASRWPTAGSLVQGLRRQIEEHLRDARRLDPLAPGSSLAAQHAIEYPIAQGPMTRVSDRAEFAAAVAEAGGLPFLALSLMTGPESRELLETTRQRLAGRPFGAGILGFVPQAVREAQLEVIRQLRPPVVLIAGGRPSQAKPLEEAGIATYLHVPSPGLLERFLREGARRFVFEGRECGGHVGPRSSFALWDAQVETILASGLAGEVSVLFAGGIHDGRSAAMAAALGAPLAAAGGRIGVLMGTAYLFTEEAVSSGAILAGFQEEALACEDTVLLETAPGHATRCAATGYVRAFEAERARLSAEGVDAKQMWAALEVLNLGRLRIASKGLTRQGDEIVEVGEDEQHREGMFMLGQVVALHDATLTVAQLHHDVSAGSSAALSALGGTDDMSTAETRRSDEDIAIIGMACIFPGAEDAEAYWANVVGGVDAVTEVPADRWDASLYYDPAATGKGAGHMTPSKWGGFLPDVPFDALAYGIPPRSLASIEPVQLLSLDVAARALEDAGYGSDTRREFDRSTVSVVFGAESGTDLASAYGFRALAPQYLGGLGDELEELLPELTEDSFPGLLTNVIAGRIANRLDLGGVNFTVDAACASSLAAVDVAMKELRAGTSDMVLCGGADLHNGINDYLLFSSVHALSPKGRCASFDAAADGIALGEGVACVVLKRASDALRDGDRVYAVIKAVSGSSDGRSLGLTAPRPEGQRQALQRAYRQAGVSPADVGLVEAHGTGTVVGDKTELAVLTELFEAAGADRASCTLGSVKSQVGHTKCAAGLAGLIKAARSVYHGVLPPTIHLENPNPGYDSSSSPFVFNTTARPWLGDRRVAGVSAFGFGGTNFHAVVAAADETAPAPEHGLVQWPAELFLLRGESASDALATLERLREHAGSASPALRDLAAATAASGSGPVQLAIVARDVADLLEKIDVACGALGAGATGASLGGANLGGAAGVFLADSTLAGTAGGSPEMAFLFPGQGSQRPGMLGELFVAFPELRRHLERGHDVAAKMLPASAFGEGASARQEQALTDTAVAQPALGMVDLAAAELLGRVGIMPRFAAGHSYGELAALAYAGAIPEDDLVELSRARADAILAAAGSDPGTMAAVAAPAGEVRALLGDSSGVVVANDNAPRQVVISGPVEAVERAMAMLTEAGVGVRRIKVACAFHSPVVSGAAAAFAERLDKCEISSPRLAVWSNTTAERYPEHPDAVRSQLARQLAEPVRFREEIEALYHQGVRVFVEVGPGNVLTGLVGKILGERPHRAVQVASRRATASDLEAFQLALAELAALGVTVDPTPLFAGRTRAVDLAATPPARPGWVVNGQLVRNSAGEIVPGALRPVAAPTAANSGRLPAAAPAQPADDPRTAVVVEYLRGLRETVAAGRDVMLQFLGASPPLPASWSQPAAAASVSYAAAAVASAGGSPATNGSGPHPDVAGHQDEPARHGSPAQLSTTQLHELVLSVVSERTGYPIEMLDAKLDLEADLSIDSIKRLEIVSELAERIGLEAAAGSAADDAVMEELVQLKTLEGVVEWLAAALTSPAAAAGEAPAGAAGQARSAQAGSAQASGATLNGHSQNGQNGRADHGHATAPYPIHPHTSPAHQAPAHGHSHAVADSHHAHGETADVPPASLRFVPRLVEIDEPRETPGGALSGRTVAVTEDGGGLAVAVAGLVEDLGGQARVVAPGDPLGACEVLVHLAGLARGPGNRALTCFERVKEALREGAANVVCVTAGGGTLGLEPPAASESPDGDGAASPAEESAALASTEGSLRFSGMRGVVKTAARELSEVAVRLVDLEPSLPVAEQAAIVLREVADTGGPTEVAWHGGRRFTASVVEDAWAPMPDPTAGFAGEDSVVLLTGGARGITARVAAAMARRWRCTLVLAGRSPEPAAGEDPALAGAATPVELRRVLAGSRFGTPAEIEAEARRVLAEREIRETLRSARQAGATVEYRRFESRDQASVRELVEGIYRDHGRLDGVVHGAGLLEDARFVDKTAESFARVYATKVNGAVALADSLRPGVRFVVLFASVSGIFGNRGQVDYAAANDALADLARWLDPRTAARVVAIDWGPWAGGGMVGPELEREFARRGVGLLEAEDAVERLLDEIRSDTPEPEVVVMRARPERFGAHPVPGSEPIAAGHASPSLPADHRHVPPLPLVVDG